VVTGADTHYTYGADEKRLPTARKYEQSNAYFECFNSALQLRIEKPVDVYHKSKLVPGVEMLPFPKVFGLLGSLAINMGGTTGSLGRQQEREVFEGPKGAKVGPIICYESVFGEFVTEYVKKGANVLFIITNDGWWDNTPGHKQHLAYATLRAIETRRYIARSANTGISCVIDDAGEIHHRAEWFEKTAIKYAIPLIDWETYYVKHGDYIARTLRWVALFSFLFGFYLRFRDKKHAKNKIQNKEKEKLRMRGIERMKKP
jgi:apolipoprotein N-acyltransferase